MIGGRCPDRLGRELPPLPVDSNDRVRVLVRIDPNDHHSRYLLRSRGRASEPAGGQIPVGERPRPSQATSAGPHALRAARRTKATKALNTVERARKTLSA